MVKKFAKHFEELARWLEGQGVHVRKQGPGGYFVLLPNGKPTLLHLTPSNHRYLTNLMHDIERSGLTIPQEIKDRLK